MSEPIPMTADRLIEFTPPSLKMKKPAPVFWLRVPTPDQRDTLSAILFRLGVRDITQDVIRATLIDDLYSLYDEEEAEAKAVELDTFWQTSRADEIAFGAWHEQEIQRQRDIEAGAPPRAAVPMPSAVTSPRTKARARLLVEHVTNCSPRMAALLERKMDYSRQQSFALVRLGVARVEKLDMAPSFKAAADGYASLADVQALRNLLSDQAWLELTEKIDAGYQMTGDEEKNFVSPPGNPSDRNGSGEPSGELANSDGSSTASNTGHAPTEGSATITG